MAEVRFDDRDLVSKVDGMGQGELDRLPFGAVEVDAKGKILTYNKGESDITGRKSTDVVGLNFFEEVAPCTDTKQFRGKFDEGVKRGRLDEDFDYAFDYRMTPTSVRIKMRRSGKRDSYWIFVKRI